MNEQTTPEKQIENPTVAKSIAKPNAFTKPGVMSTKTRMRVMSVKNTPKSRRLKKRDPRYVEYY